MCVHACVCVSECECECDRHRGVWECLPNCLQWLLITGCGDVEFSFLLWFFVFCINQIIVYNKIFTKCYVFIYIHILKWINLIILLSWHLLGEEKHIWDWGCWFRFCDLVSQFWKRDKGFVLLVKLTHTHTFTHIYIIIFKLCSFLRVWNKTTFWAWKMYQFMHFFMWKYIMPCINR